MRYRKSLAKQMSADFDWGSGDDPGFIYQVGLQILVQKQSEKA